MRATSEASSRSDGVVAVLLDRRSCASSGAARPLELEADCRSATARLARFSTSRANLDARVAKPAAASSKPSPASVRDCGRHHARCPGCARRASSRSRRIDGRASIEIPMMPARRCQSATMPRLSPLPSCSIACDRRMNWRVSCSVCSRRPLDRIAPAGRDCVRSTRASSTAVGVAAAGAARSRRASRPGERPSPVRALTASTRPAPRSSSRTRARNCAASAP